MNRQTVAFFSLACLATILLPHPPANAAVIWHSQTRYIECEGTYFYEYGTPKYLRFADRKEAPGFDRFQERLSTDFPDQDIWISQDSWFGPNEFHAVGESHNALGGGNHWWVTGSAKSLVSIRFSVTQPTRMRLSGRARDLEIPLHEDLYGFIGEYTDVLYPNNGMIYDVAIEMQMPSNEGYASFVLDAEFTPVPEPAALATALLAAGGLFLKRRARLP